MSVAVEERAKKIVLEELGCAEASVTREARLREDLGADILDIVGLVMAFEEEFGCEITDDEGDKLLTFGECVDLIAGRAES